MAALPPGQAVAPGTATGNTYPQWGIGQIGGTWKTIEAKTAAEKIADLKLGYLDWFSSAAAAQQQVSSQSSALNGNIPNPLNYALSVTGISGWFVRGLKVVIGSVLMILAIGRLTGVSNKVTELAGKAIPMAVAA